MKSISVAASLAVLPGALAWGGFGHISVAYLASNFVSNETAAYFQGLLRNDTEHYLAGVATWADSIRYTKWGHFTGVFHFIDAKDTPPTDCNVDFERDCKEEGCVVSAIQNYTAQILDSNLPEWRRNQAAKFVIHFVGDIHQPLHDEDVSRGGNGIPVLFERHEYNLHHVWDSSIPEKLVGGVRRGRNYIDAQRWAEELTHEIHAGKFKYESETWSQGLDLEDSISTALGWAREANRYVCSTVLPQGAAAIKGQELGTDYYLAAAPVVEIQIARAGYRLAKWLDLIVASITSAESAVDSMVPDL
ncbi:S1/P1 nuclease [Thozetella sp. PMI_491]|nr:S1/P1 nuclease [Thozetella sp. PMI_491]